VPLFVASGIHLATSKPEREARVLNSSHNKLGRWFGFVALSLTMSGCLSADSIFGRKKDTAIQANAMSTDPNATETSRDREYQRDLTVRAQDADLEKARLAAETARYQADKGQEADLLNASSARDNEDIRQQGAVRVAQINADARVDEANAENSLTALGMRNAGSILQGFSGLQMVGVQRDQLEAQQDSQDAANLMRLSTTKAQVDAQLQQAQTAQYQAESNRIQIHLNANTSKQKIDESWSAELNMARDQLTRAETEEATARGRHDATIPGSNYIYSNVDQQNAYNEAKNATTSVYNAAKPDDQSQLASEYKASLRAAESKKAKLEEYVNWANTVTSPTVADLARIETFNHMGANTALPPPAIPQPVSQPPVQDNGLMCVSSDGKIGVTGSCAAGTSEAVDALHEINEAVLGGTSDFNTRVNKLKAVANRSIKVSDPEEARRFANTMLVIEKTLLDAKKQIDSGNTPNYQQTFERLVRDSKVQEMLEMQGTPFLVSGFSQPGNNSLFAAIDTATGTCTINGCEDFNDMHSRLNR
jgi:hypothetical protein